jgi:galactokinase
VTVTAFAPGRVNLIGEHTDYNGGLALPFAIEQGVRCQRQSQSQSQSPASPYVREVMLGLGITEDVSLEVDSDLPQGAGLSSSAALTVAAALALGADADNPLALAKLAQRVEHSLGADTGLLDQLAILLGRAGHAVRIDFRELEWRHVPLDLGEWTLATIDSGASHSHAESGYNERRAECRSAAAELGVATLSDAHRDDALDLRDPLGRRLRHVLSENERVDATVQALESGDLARVGELLDASHASLRDLYDASVPAVEATVARAKDAGAAGARMMGGGFGGAVLALLPAGRPRPDGAVVVAPGPAARLV